MPYADKTKLKLHEAWRHMLHRCENEKHFAYKDYGGRGITVCEEWHSFNTFFEWAISSGFSLGLTLDRIDVNKGYEPSNCKWATRKEQGNNRRTNTLITFNGKTQTMAQWAEEIGITRHTLWARLRKYKMPLEIALTAKKNEYNRWNRKEKLNG